MKAERGRIVAYEIKHDTDLDHTNPGYPRRISTGADVKIEWRFDTLEDAQAFLESLPIPDWARGG